MTLNYEPYVPKSASEVMDELAGMMLRSPDFKDSTGYFPERNIDTEFFSLNEGLKNLRQRLGEERYNQLIAMSNRMRAHFEADPDNETDETIKGREIVIEMEDILMGCPEIWVDE
jgi:hypothetical protein